MQEPDSNDLGATQPQESETVLQLRAEYTRLSEKRAQSDDPDIIAVLDMRLNELRSALSSVPEAEAAPAPEESDEIKKLRLELQKLKEKRLQTKDRNVIAVLEMRIAQIEPTLPPPPKSKIAPKVEVPKEEEIEFEKIPLPSAAQSEAAEKLVKQSMLEKRRGNAIGATDLLKKAVDAAPGSAVVLEALGDDLLERKLTKQARETFKRALQLDPKNVGLERKFAQTVLQSTMTMSVEDQLRYGISDSMFLTANDNVAGLKAAKILSAIFPGLGQIVIGRTVKGAVLLGVDIICIGLIAIWHKDFEALMRFAFGKGSSPTGTIFIPILGIAITWVVSMMDLSGGSGGSGSRQSKVERPKPPVDLPFD